MLTTWNAKVSSPRLSMFSFLSVTVVTAPLLSVSVISWQAEKAVEIRLKAGFACESPYWPTGDRGHDQ